MSFDVIVPWILTKRPATTGELRCRSAALDTEPLATDRAQSASRRRGTHIVCEEAFDNTGLYTMACGIVAMLLVD